MTHTTTAPSATAASATAASAETAPAEAASAEVAEVAEVQAAAVQAAADTLVSAFAEGRLDDYFAAFAPEATFVFHSTPVRLTSTSEYRALWQTWVDQDDFRVLGCTSTSPLIQLLGSTAVFSHEVETVISTREGEETLRERESIVFRLTSGQATPDGEAPRRWLAVHEHLSPAPEA